MTWGWWIAISILLILVFCIGYAVGFIDERHEQRLKKLREEQKK